MSYDVFISYRRKTGVNDARLLQQALRSRGYSVFFDYDSLRDGQFDGRILQAIDETRIFILMLTENSLDGCLEEGDWVRREIECAIKNGKKIVPVKPSDQAFEFPASLPHCMECVKNEQISELNKAALFEESVDKLIRDRFPQGVKPTLTSKYGLLLIAAVIALLMSVLLMVWQNEDDTTTGDDGKKSVEESDAKKIADEKNRVMAPPMFIFDYKGDLDGVVLNGSTDIAIPEGVRRINIYALTNSAITSVRFPDSLEEIGYKAFADCRLLTNITFGAGLKRLSQCAFAGCNRLSGVFEFPEGLESMGRALVFCSSKITDVVVPSTLCRMEEQEFIGCGSSLKRIWFKGNAPTIPDGSSRSDKYKYETSPFCGMLKNGLTILVPKGSTGWKDSSSELPFYWPNRPELKRGACKIANYSGRPPVGTSGVALRSLNRNANVVSSESRKRTASPSNNDYSSPKELIGVNGCEVASNVAATSNSGEFLNGIFGSDHTLWYRWIAPQSGIAEFDTLGSDFDTVMGVLKCVGGGGALSITVNDDVGEGLTTSRVVFKVSAGTEYRISVGGSRGASGCVHLNWKLQPEKQ